jgi:alkylated DNA repair dioxygenase AlkB
MEIISTAQQMLPQTQSDDLLITDPQPQTSSLIDEPTTKQPITFDPINLGPGEVKRISLMKDDSSWIEVQFIPNELIDYATEKFDELFQLHPAQKGNVVMYGKELKSSRWHQSYMETPKRDPAMKHSYMFCGLEDSPAINQPLPVPFQPFNDYMLQKDSKYNQMVANWYKDGLDYIAQHSDCEMGMIDNAVISLINLNQSNLTENCRIFRIRPKFADQNAGALYSEYQVILRHGLLITMGGHFQKQFKHGVPKVLPMRNQSLIPVPRMSLSFRQFASSKKRTNDDVVESSSLLNESAESSSQKRMKFTSFNDHPDQILM